MCSVTPQVFGRKDGLVKESGRGPWVVPWPAFLGSSSKRTVVLRVGRLVVRIVVLRVVLGVVLRVGLGVTTSFLGCGQHTFGSSPSKPQK